MNLLPTDAQERKRCPVYSGVVKYFPDALVAVARCSQVGNDQHNPGQHLHWDKSKSADELDALMRHIIEGEWESVAWRALANLQREIDKGYVPKSFTPTTNEEDLPEPLSWSEWQTNQGWGWCKIDRIYTRIGWACSFGESYVQGVYKKYLKDFAKNNGVHAEDGS